jgi:hypothetical protein
VLLSGSDIPGSAWRKAQLSVNNGACVEVAPTSGMIAMRDSKDPSGPVLTYTRIEWSAFLDGVKKGEFDDLCG